ncbi:MAG: formate/nitrite transporter family protein [Ktedonobacterales bacterium]
MTQTPTANNLPDVSEEDREEAKRRAPPSALIVHETVREEGERELDRSVAALAWSALAAGLSMGFSLVTQGLMRAYLPDAHWRPLVASLGYSVGFLIVILGRQQLFTENTLTAMLPLLSHPSLHTLWRVVRLWSIVLVGNLVGALLFALLLAHISIFPPFVVAQFGALAHENVHSDFGGSIMRGIFAGWLIALMVWLLPAAQAGRIHIIVILTYVVALGGFGHIIAGSVEAFYAVSIGAISWQTCLTDFTLPTLIGNIIGGVSLVAALNYAQVVTDAHNT